MTESDLIEKDVNVTEISHAATVSTDRLRAAPNVHSTEIIRSMFGTSVGSCWGDFSCQYHRQQGRLYAASNAVLFYSQLFGFERKVCAYFQDIVHMEAYRSTSIRITTVDSEQHVFKSFSNRSLVVQLLFQLRGIGTTSEARLANDTSFTSDVSVTNEEVERDETPQIEQNNAAETDDTTASSPSADIHSTPVIRNGPVPAVGGKKLTTKSKSLSCLDNEKALDDVISSVPPTEYDSSSLGSTPEEETQLEAAWEEIVKTSTADFKETALEGLELCCDLKEFFTLFLADDAPYSTGKYQQEVIGDADMETSQWTEDGATLTRTASFRHPITAKTFGFGPSSVRTTIRQRLRRFGSIGTCIETSSSIEGSPGADCFTVEDQWLLAQQGPGKIALTVRFESRFSKRTMLKSIIQKSIRQETIEWYKGYADMIKESLLSEGRDRNEPNVRSDEKESSLPMAIQWRYNWRLYVVVGLALVVVVSMFVTVLVLLLHVVRLQELLGALQEEIRQLRVENTAAAREVAEAITAARRPAECESAQFLQG